MNVDAPLSAGKRFRQAMATETPLQIVGCVNALCAQMAAQAGFKAIYLSGAGVANACFGLPDLGMTTLTEVAQEVRRITSAIDLPLLVDVDTGWGDELSVARCARVIEKAGAAGVHIEDQTASKRCGHRPGKHLVSADEMAARIGAAIDGRNDANFVVMARTDAVANEGIDAAIERCRLYVSAGADAIFAEALEDLETYQRFTEAVGVPVLANMTEFGRTPLLTLEQFREAGVSMVLYPLSAFRAMNAAAEKTYQVIRRDGTQAAMIDEMQTRDQLYEILDYHHYETLSEQSGELRRRS